MQWIKYSDQMPQIGSEVIIAQKTYSGKIIVTSVWVTQYLHAKTEKGRRVQFHKNMRIQCELEDIVGWMPLPYPPTD